MFAIGSMLTIPLLLIPFGETMLEKIKKTYMKKVYGSRTGNVRDQSKETLLPPMSIDSPYLSGSPRVAGPVGTGLREAEHRHHRALPPPSFI